MSEKKRKKRQRQVKFKDVLAMYKYVKDIYARLDVIDSKISNLEKEINMIHNSIGQTLAKLAEKTVKNT